MLLALVAAGCGKEIGDDCVVSSDCSTAGDRICDISSPGGYCTIQGCDFNTCPDESVCVSFFTGSFANKPCVRETEDAGTDDCTFDEICSLAGQCVSRSSEIRYCMRTCGSDGDCRDNYECRDEALMREHGGEPVVQAGDLPSFCAPAVTTF